MTNSVRKAIQNVTIFLSKEQTEVLKTAILLMGPSLLSKLLGLVYMALTSNQLGTGQAINDFNTANIIPEALTNILLLGVISAVVIPVFIESREKDGEKRFLRVYNTLINANLGIFIIASVSLFFFGEHILSLVTDTRIYQFKPDEFASVVNMMKVLMVPNFILGISVFVASGLNVYQRVLIPQLSLLFFNIGKIFGVLFLLPLMKNSPWALVAGIIIGSVLHLTIQLPLARSLGLQYQRTLDFTDKYVRKIFNLSLPRGLAFSAEQIALVVSKSITTGITLARKGETISAITTFSYANQLALVIPQLFGLTFAIASFPTLSRLFAKQNLKEIQSITIKTINQIFFLAAPITVTVIVLRLPIVRLTFGLFPGTQFSREDTTAVAWTLLLLSFGVLFTAGKWYLFRLFFAAKNTMIPFMVSLVNMTVTVFGGIMFTNLLSHSHEFSVFSINLNLNNLFVRAGGEPAVGGVALAISVATILEFFLLLFLTHWKIVKLDFGLLIDGIFRKLIPLGVMTSLMFLMFKTWEFLSFPIDATPGFTGSTTLNLFALTGITVLTSFMVYYLLCYLFRVEELKILRKLLNPIFRLGGLVIK